MDLVIFDLDGTLIDSRVDLANGVNAMRVHMGLEPLAFETVCSYVGHGAPVLIRRALGEETPQADVDRGLEFFLQSYRAHAMDNTVLYPGVAATLDRLAAAGKTMAVLTNKPTPISCRILEALGAARYFFRIYGGNSFQFKKPHPIGIETLMRETAIGREATVMVGDSAIDIETARNAGVAACGLTYGFQPETLSDPAPNLLADRMEQVADWILNGGK